jgi:hypothetical protein
MAAGAGTDLDSEFAAAFGVLRADQPAKHLKRLERVKGIEPSYSAWKAAALPLSYTRDFSNFKRYFASSWPVFGAKTNEVTSAPT